MMGGGESERGIALNGGVMSGVWRLHQDLKFDSSISTCYSHSTVKGISMEE